jgi:hypothetical protein
MSMYTYCMLFIFIVPVGILRLPWLRSFHAFSSVVSQMSGYNSQRRGTAHILPEMFVFFYVLFVLCLSVYCLCVNVHCITATCWQPNWTLTNISYHKLIRILWQSTSAHVETAVRVTACLAAVKKTVRIRKFLRLGQLYKVFCGVPQ